MSTENDDETFVLERVENPHPRMLRGALVRRAEWRGYLAAMCDATGETPEAIEAWLDRMES